MHIREINMFFKRGSKFLKTVAAVRTKCLRTILGVTYQKQIPVRSYFLERKKKQIHRDKAFLKEFCCIKWQRENLKIR